MNTKTDLYWETYCNLLKLASLLFYVQKATWQGFSKDGTDKNDLMFRVERTMNTLTRLEFQVFLNNDDPDFKMRGSPFYRSCTIYKGNSIVAQVRFILTLYLSSTNKHGIMLATHNTKCLKDLSFCYKATIFQN